MGPVRPFITKRAHTKSRSGCKECKRRKQKCNEARPKCEKCAKRGVECEYIPRPPPHALRIAEGIEEEESLESNSPSSKAGSLYSSNTEYSLLDDLAVRPRTRDELNPIRRVSPLFTRIPGVLRTPPWRNEFEHQLYNVFYSTHRETMDNPGMDDATKEIWLNVVPKVALHAEGALFRLLLSIGSLHAAMKSPDYRCLQSSPSTQNSLELSKHYFGEAISSYRNIVEGDRALEINPEVCYVTALVLSFRASLIVNHRYEDAEHFYNDVLCWFGVALGYIGIGGFYTDKLRNTQLGHIMKANPGATYHFPQFKEYISRLAYPWLDYLHPRTDTEDTVDPEDLSEEALDAYEMTIKLIGWVHQATTDGSLKGAIYTRFQMVPYAVPKHFQELLNQRRPRAVAVLAHYIALPSFLGAYEHLHFWPEEQISLLSTIVPSNWIWAMKKALQIVEQGRDSAAGLVPPALPMRRNRPAQPSQAV